MIQPGHKLGFRSCLRHEAQADGAPTCGEKNTVSTLLYLEAQKGFMPMPKKITVVRSSITGQFVKKIKAKTNPRTTETEHYTRRKPKKK